MSRNSAGPNFRQLLLRGLGGLALNRAGGGDTMAQLGRGGLCVWLIPNATSAAASNRASAKEKTHDFGINRIALTHFSAAPKCVLRMASSFEGHTMDGW